jgi:hypothetical protein
MTLTAIRDLRKPPNQRLQLSARGGHIGWNKSILSVAAAGRS